MLAAGGVCLLLLTALSSRPAGELTTKPEPVSASPRAIIAAARLAPDGGVVQVGASVDLGTGIVELLLVREGEEVVKGQALAYLGSHASMMAALGQAEAQTEVARAGLDRATDGELKAAISAQLTRIDTLRIERAQADLNLSRAVDLYARNALAAATRDERRLSAERAASAWTLAQQEHAVAIAAREDAMRIARAQLALAESAVKRAMADLDQTVVRAPGDGVVLRVVARAGERIGPDGLLQLGDTRRTYAVAEVFVGDLPFVVQGLDATVSGGPLREPVEGVVERITAVAGARRMEGVDGASSRGERVAEVWIRLPESTCGVYDSIVKVAISLRPRAQIPPRPNGREPECNFRSPR